DPAGFSKRNPEDEIPVDVTAAGGNFKRRIGAKDQIGLAKLPSGIEMRSRRKIGRIAFRHTILHPFLEKRDFFGQQMKGGVEFPLTGFREPRRHDALLRDVRNLARMRLQIAVGQQREGTGLARMMAGGAGAKHDWGQVTIESYAV